MEKSSQQLQCSRCGKTYANNQQRLKHERQNRCLWVIKNGKKVGKKCLKCDKFFTLSKTLEEHLRLTTCGISKFKKGVGSFPCSDCGYRFSSKVHMTNHRKWDRCKVRKLLCSLNVPSPVNDEIPKVRTKEEIRKDGIECRKCGAVLHGLYARNRHEANNSCQRSAKRRQGLGKRIQCDKCGLKFGPLAYKEHRSKTPCGKHRKTENNNGRYKCDICGRGFSTTTYVKRHKNNGYCARYLLKEMVPSCPQCGMTFSTWGQQRMHLVFKCKVNEDSNKNEEVKSTRSSLPEKVVKSKNQNKIHKQSPLEGKTPGLHESKKSSVGLSTNITLKCDICGYVCNRPESLFFHIPMTHHGVCTSATKDPSEIYCSTCSRTVPINHYPSHAHSHIFPSRVRNQYCCRICNINLSSQCYLHFHLAAHGVFPIKMPFYITPGHFSERWRVSDAVRRTVTIFPCGRCKFQTMYQADLFDHLSKHHHVQLTSKSIVSPLPNNHTKLWTCDKTFKCHVCLSNFQSPTLAAIHVQECETIYGIFEVSRQL